MTIINVIKQYTGVLFHHTFEYSILIDRINVDDNKNNVDYK